MIKQHNYTEEEKAFLIEYVPGHTRKEIVEEFKNKFGWEMTVGQLKCRMKTYGLKTGNDGKFKKGYPSHNKGKKMPDEVYQKAKAGMFKKGQKPHNTDPVGTEKVFENGYTYIKIKDDLKVKSWSNWIAKHRMVWEEHNGPVKPGEIIIFLDGDSANCNIENLALTTRKELLTMNRNNLKSDDPEITKVGLNVSKLMNAIYDKRSEE